MPERQPPVMRTASASERVRDWLRGLYEGASDQPLGQIADALGVADLGGVAEELDSPRPDGLRIGMAGRKVPVPQVAAKMGGAGKRIKPQQQSALDPGLKIPRFRSEQGTFVKHEGEWWKLPKQPGDGRTISLERYNPDTEQVMKRTLSMDDFYQGVLDAKGTKLPGSPKRRK